MKSILLFTTCMFLTACMATASKAPIYTDKNIMPRYVSPLKYVDYNCNELNKAYKDTRTVELKYVEKVLKNENGTTKLRSSDGKELDNEINSAPAYTYHDVIGISRGHLEAIKKYAKSIKCSNFGGEIS